MAARELGESPANNRHDMGAHTHTQTLAHILSHFFAPAELHSTGSTADDELPCGTIQCVKTANGRNDPLHLLII